MKLCKYGAIGFLSALGALAACSSDATSGAGAPVPCNLAAAAPCPALVSCAQEHCSAQLNTAFGADYKSGSCKDWVACLDACGCNDTACTTACSATPGQSAACQQDYQAVGSCSNNACPNACSGGGSAGSGAGGSAGSGASGFAGSAGSGTSGAGGSTSGGWDCEPGSNPGECACAQLPGTPQQDNCTSKAPCCIELVSSGYNTCACADPGTSSCSDVATQVSGTVVSTCPPP